MDPKIFPALYALLLHLAFGSAHAAPTPVLAFNFNVPASAHALRLLENEYLEITPNLGKDGSTALRATYVPFERGTIPITGRFPIPPALEYTLNYDVFFEENFQFTRGGKLHGLTPDAPHVGGNIGRPESWSARVTFLKNHRLSLYVYHQNMRRQYGEGGLKQAPEFRVQKGRWYSVALHVRVNEAPSNKDGFVRLYVDGILVESMDNLQLRAVGSEQSLISNFQFSTFHGGNTDKWSPKDPDGNPVSVNALFDNIAIYPGEYIQAQPSE